MFGQPWASLCVMGIKRYEGRSWHTSYRGRLYIASTAKPVEQLDIDELELEYKQIYSSCTGVPPFPSSYPSGVLLGCCDLIDCMNQQQFQQHRNDEIKRGVAIENSSSRYIMQLTNPHIMILQPRISGQHKLYALSDTMAQQAIKPVSQTWRISGASKKSNKPSVQRHNTTNKVNLVPLHNVVK